MRWQQSDKASEGRGTRGGRGGGEHMVGRGKSRKRRGDRPVPLYMRVRHAFPKANSPVKYVVCSEFA